MINFYSCSRGICFIVALLFLLFSGFNINPEARATTLNDMARLEKGEILVESLTPRLKGNLKGAESKIFIQAPPEKVWDVLYNQDNLPKFVSRFKKVKVLEKNNSYQVVQVAVKVSSFLPLFKYKMVLDTTEKYKRVKFNKTEGCFKKLYGVYEIEPYKGGTVLTYRMFIDIGFFVPNFVCSSSLRGDLPDVMKAIKREAENN